MANYAPSTRARIADLITGMHVKTTDAVLGTSVFTNAAQTEIFTVVGRIAIVQLFLEITGTFDANATTVAFNCTWTTPAIAVNEMQADCGSLASLTQGVRVMFVGGVVATGLIITDSAGLTDVESAGKLHIIGGETAAGVNYIGSIGMLTAAATQATTASATGHLFYYPMSAGAYAVALV